MSDLEKYENDFSALQGTSEVTDFLQKHHREVGETVTRLASSASSQSLLQRLFPGKLQRVLLDARVQEAKTELDFRHAALELSAKAKMEAVEEQCQSMVAMVKAHHRAQFASFVTKAFEDLERDIDTKIGRYLEAARKRYETYEQYKDLPVGESYLRHVQQAEQAYFAWVNRLLENFRAITEERVRQYRL